LVVGVAVVVVSHTYPTPVDKMAFAAARMIMPKDKQTRKTSADLQGMGRNRNKVS